MAVEQQSPDIAAGVHLDRNPEDVGAGDQVRVSRTHITVLYVSAVVYFNSPIRRFVNIVKLLYYVSFCVSH